LDPLNEWTGSNHGTPPSALENSFHCDCILVYLRFAPIGKIANSFIKVRENGEFDP
jgi:hypothetical protein